MKEADQKCTGEREKMAATLSVRLHWQRNIPTFLPLEQRHSRSALSHLSVIRNISTQLREPQFPGYHTWSTFPKASLDGSKASANITKQKSPIRERNKIPRYCWHIVKKLHENTRHIEEKSNSPWRKNWIREDSVNPSPENWVQNLNALFSVGVFLLFLLFFCECHSVLLI